jgi:hypothetical protein
MGSVPSISLLPSTSACDAAAPCVSEFAETSKLEEIVYKANTKVSINTYYIAVRVLQSAEDADCGTAVETLTPEMCRI